MFYLCISQSSIWTCQYPKLTFSVHDIGILYMKLRYSFIYRSAFVSLTVMAFNFLEVKRNRRKRPFPWERYSVMPAQSLQPKSQSFVESWKFPTFQILFHMSKSGKGQNWRVVTLVMSTGCGVWSYLLIVDVFLTYAEIQPVSRTYWHPFAYS